MTTVSVVECPKCGYSVFSRTQHDFRKCFCGSVSIDGGFAYTKVSFSPEIDPPKVERKEIPQTPMELYDDWNERRNIYGLIPPVFKMEEEDDKNENKV